MTLAALALLVTASLSEGDRAARLLDDPPPPGQGMLLAQAAAELPPAAAQLQTKSLAELREEYDRLDRSRPKLFPPIIMLAGGLVAAVPGAFMTLLGTLAYLPGVRSSGVISPLTLLVVGLVLLVVGGTFAIIGGVTLGPAVKKRREISAEMDLVETRITELEPPNDEDLPKNKGRVRLTVVDKKTGAPLANAAVKVGASTLTTNAYGLVTTGTLPPGPVTLEVARAEYGLASEAAMVVAGQTAELSLSLLADKDREPATVTGIVRGVDGGTRLKAKVAIEELKLEVAAADDGTFSLPVPGGTWSVTITAKGYAPQKRPLEVKWGDRAILNVDLHRAEGRGQRSEGQ